MEMQQVRYFLAVARTLNFTRAAEDCAISQPALTRAIQQLEAELGGELIAREGRQTHLTDLGHRMQPMLQQVYDSAAAAKLLAARVKQGEISTLGLAVSRTLDIDLLLPLMSELRRAFPDLQFKLRRGGGAQVYDMLRRGEVDLAIGGPLGESWDRLESWPMFTESFGIVVGQDHELAMQNGPGLDVELVRRHRLLRHADADPAELPHGVLESAGLRFDEAHHFESDRDLEALVVANFGIAIVPASTLRSGRVRRLSCHGIDLERTVAMYSVAGRPRSREATALYNLVRSADWSRRLQPAECV